jgi:hypothetical protein
MLPVQSAPRESQGDDNASIEVDHITTRLACVAWVDIGHSRSSWRSGFEGGHGGSGLLAALGENQVIQPKHRRE